LPAAYLHFSHIQFFIYDPRPLSMSTLQQGSLVQILYSRSYTPSPIRNNLKKIRLVNIAEIHISAVSAPLPPASSPRTTTSAKSVTTVSKLGNMLSNATAVTSSPTSPVFRSGCTKRPDLEGRQYAAETAKHGRLAVFAPDAVAHLCYARSKDLGSDIVQFAVVVSAPNG
jgi:hypothetical protein